MIYRNLFISTNAFPLWFSLPSTQEEDSSDGGEYDPGEVGEEDGDHVISTDEEEDGTEGEVPAAKRQKVEPEDSEQKTEVES